MVRWQVVMASKDFLMMWRVSLMAYTPLPLCLIPLGGSTVLVEPRQVTLPCW